MEPLKPFDTNIEYKRENEVKGANIDGLKRKRNKTARRLVSGSVIYEKGNPFSHVSEQRLKSSLAKKRSKKRKKIVIYFHSASSEKVVDMLAYQNEWEVTPVMEKATYVHFRRERGTNYSLGHDYMVINSLI